MNDDVYFEGDPATDSARRHMERVLKGKAPRRRWLWVAAPAAAVAAWYFWPRSRVRVNTQPDDPGSDGKS